MQNTVVTNFICLNRDVKVSEILRSQPDRKNISFVRNVQSGKTSDILEMAQEFYQESALIVISQNCITQGQTKERAKGFEQVNYKDGGNLALFLMKAVGKKKIIHVLMEINNLQKLVGILETMNDLPVTIFYDEADKNQNKESANSKKAKKVRKERKQMEPSYDDVVEEDEPDEEDEQDKADGSLLPPVTMLLARLMDLVQVREDSRNVLVTATPIGILTAEKRDWLVLYKESYLNYVGCGRNHSAAIHIMNHIPATPVDHRNRPICPVKLRWTGHDLDVRGNNFKQPVIFAVNQFAKCPNKCDDQDILQIMLVTLEQQKAGQDRMGKFIQAQVDSECPGEIGIAVAVLNGDTKESNDSTLADLIRSHKNKGFKKLIVIAAFMASRGVSFTDFSDKTLMFELVLQVHYTKKYFPLNSSLQNMRIFGPARRTVSRPAIICNSVCEEDLRVNFCESYRIMEELATKGYASQGAYNSQRPITQSYNLRYIKQGWMRERFLYPSTNEADHLPISK